MKENPLVFTVSYRSSGGSLYNDQFIIDFAEIEGIGRVGDPPLFRIAESLKKLQEDVSGLRRAGTRRTSKHPAEGKEV